MKIKHVVAAVLMLALAVPAFACKDSKSSKTSAAVASADHCGSAKTSAVVASADHGCCANKASAAVWAGAWLERANGSVRVADVAKNSPAARSGLKAGDIVVAVNGNRAIASKGECSLTHEECTIGSSVAYTVQRGRSTRVMKLKLEKMPATATERFADREASFDPALATLVLTTN